jgi:hypothetical protein
MSEGLCQASQADRERIARPAGAGPGLGCQGLGAREAANMLGISEPTVRTHLQYMFAKTHTLPQADLLRLLRTSTPPVRAPQPRVL